MPQQSKLCFNFDCCRTMVGVDNFICKKKRSPGLTTLTNDSRYFTAAKTVDFATFDNFVGYRYLYVNVRRWVGDWRDQLNDMLPRPPPISNKVELLVYDLLTMKHVSSLSGHNAVSEVFFIHLSANDLYVASGSEDSRGYMWDRHYKAPVATFSHDDVVNCVAVNPRDPSMAVSVSDDKSIKIWRSKSFHRLLKGARPKARIKFRTHNQHQSSKV